MLIRLRLGLFLVAPLLSVATSSAQQLLPAHPPTKPDDSTIRLDVVTAVKNGPPFGGLQQKDFTLLDNKNPEPITSFRAVVGDDAPVETIILVDSVNTDYSNVAYIRDQIDKVLRANGGRLDHPTALAFLSDDGVKLQNGFTKDGNALSASLDNYTVGLRTLRRSSGIYGADDRFQISLSALHQISAHEATVPGRKLILWVSPGWPILSGPGIELDSKQEQGIFNDIVSLSTQLRENRITLYAINPLGTAEGVGRSSYYEEFLKGVSKPSQVNIGNLSLQVLAAQSGGLVADASNDISALLKRCLEDTTAYYEITFKAAPAERPNEYHHIEIKLSRPELTARTRDGYYSQP